MESFEAALARLCDPEAEVSAHYLIALDGAVTALVPEEARAWHAGAGAWGACSDVNSHSLGIELENEGQSPFPWPQMRALIGLLAQLRARWAIAPERVIAHSDMAPTRKSDPGRRFDWAMLAAEGQSVWPKAETLPPVADPLAFERALTAIGYPPAPPEARLQAFRLRFAPAACGPFTARDLALAEDLARRFPVDQAAAGA